MKLKQPLLPLADSTPGTGTGQNSPCSGRVMKPLAYLAVLSTALLAFGLVCLQTDWLSIEQGITDLTKLTSSYTVKPKPSVFGSTPSSQNAPEAPSSQHFTNMIMISMHQNSSLLQSWANHLCHAHTSLASFSMHST